MLRDYEKVAAEARAKARIMFDTCRASSKLEFIDRERRMVERRIRAARFPATKSFDTFDFTAIPSLNKPLVLELARCEYVVARLPTRSFRRLHDGGGPCPSVDGGADEKRLLRLQAQLAAVKLLIVDELGYVPLSQTGAELLFEVFSQRHERGPTIVMSNLPFDEWTSVFGNQRLTGALLDRLTHHTSTFWR